MTTRVLVNGAPEPCVDVRDRGLTYGDGLFETCLLADGAIALWQWHMQRLLDGCRRLRLDAPEPAVLAAEAAHVAAGLAHAVVRVTITRGVGARGYAPQHNAPPTRIVSASPAPRTREDWSRGGMRLRWCTMRLSAQPALAGMKHLNRLENVLARAEWQGADIDEGLLRGMDGMVVGATAANLFVVRDGRIMTPPLTQCGVAGVMRAWIMDTEPVVQRELDVDDVMQADEIFLTNAVRGIMPVGHLAGRQWPVGPVTRRLMARCAMHGLPPGARC